MNIKRKTLNDLSHALKLEEEFNYTIQRLNEVDIEKSTFILAYGDRLTLIFRDSNGKDFSVANQDESVRREGKHHITRLLPPDLKNIIIESIQNALIEHSRQIVKEAKKQFKQELLGED